ncbi:MAG: CBS domain-containing protein [Polaribacter sp.]|jgi:CBS domain-containing membrane protein|uniref:CBS domain-containing protein n=1 Tax=Polaribacter sp. TaxID=1920175 RepID=UPI0026042C8B|nr:CBS domain-containing protein [Polaribacter sp.]MBT3740873.1 CBS domain-containing protein [Polaribacter sp.]MBT7816604.1 CBS domain-containing protein [Polaribacter sp.]MDG1195102.1 CBS domain-containing protein [Polaribacter sp.]MDG1403075.1 CBS domain-containing protein [Polaribacter sp.]MDG2437583.1 CBS domain-containing protein [Polaribacter sp.]
MKRTTPISEIMTTEVVTLNVADRLETAEKLFKKYKIRHIPVVKDKAVLGMLSYTDLLRISFADVSDDETSIDAFVYDMFSIQQVMAKNLFMVAPNSTIKEVAELLSKKEFHALPVVEDNELVGIVTTTDLINYLIAQL